MKSPENKKKKISKEPGGGVVSKESLPESKDFYKNLISRVPDALIILDKKGVLIDVSEMAEKLSGYKKSEVIGKSLLTMSILDIPTKAIVAKKLAFHFAGNELAPFEISIHRKDGKTIPAEINANMVEVGGKKICTAIIRDISDRKKADERYENIIRNSIDGFWVTDKEGHFLEVNESYCKSIGYTRNELLKMKISDVEIKERSEDVDNRIKKIIKTGIDRFETQHKCKDGKIIDFEITVNHAKGVDDRLYVFLREITEKRSIAENMKRSEELYRTLTESLSDRIYIIDKGGCVTFVNSSASKESKIKKIENVCIDVSLIFPKRTAEIIKKSVEDVIVKKNSALVEVHDADNGADMWSEIRMSPIKNQSGNVESVIMILRDITERKESETLYMTLAESITDKIYLVDENNCLKFVNTSAAGSGAKRDELVCRDIKTLFSRDISQFLITAIDNVFKTGKPLENEIHGTIEDRWMDVKMSPIRNDAGKVESVMIIISDITERKNIESEIERSEELHRTLTESISDRLYFFDENRCIKFVNSAAAKSHNVNQSDMVCRSIESLFSPEISNFLKEKIDEVMKLGKPVASEFHETSENSDTWHEMRISPVTKESGKPDSVIIISHDITKRKKAEQSVLESEIKFRNLVENSLVGIYKTNMDGQILFANQALVNMFGYRNLEEMQKIGIIKLYSNTDDRNRLLATLKQNRSIPNFETIYTRTNKKQINVLLSATLEGNEISGMMMDITDRKIAEEQMKKMNDELNVKISELERFNKVAVGRELRMVELKKKIAELEGGHGK